MRETTQTLRTARHLAIGTAFALALLGRGPDVPTAVRVCAAGGEPRVASFPAMTVRVIDGSSVEHTELVDGYDGEGVFADGGLDAGNVTGPQSDELVLRLRELQPLTKVHYSWPLPDGLFDIPDDPRLVEYVRITHAASVSGEWCEQRHIDAAVRICKRINATNPEVPASMAINYSPWHREFGADLPPTDVGPTHEAELRRFRERLSLIRQWLEQANRGQRSDVRITALLLDSERLYVKPGDAAVNAAITTKYDLIHEIGKKIFPFARIEWYGRGIEESANDTGWSPLPWNTFENKADTFSCSLYRVPEIGVMRETFRRTLTLARQYGVSEVTPWVALASGYRRQIDAFQTWDEDWDYDLIYSWMLGTELNQPWYGDRPMRYAPWNAAKIVVFYPAPFNPLAPHWGKHFVAYVRGANGVKTLPD